MRKNQVVVATLVATLLAAGCRRSEQVAPSQPPASASTPPVSVKVPTVTGIEVGQRMAPYTATFLDGKKFDLADRKGRVVLLNLWATWCGPCRYEIPELQSLHDKHAERGLDVVGVSVDETGIQVVKDFVDERKMTYPIVLDPLGNLANLLQSSVLPTTILIDRGGTIVWKRYGAIQEDDPELQKAMAAAL